jgi:DNA-binding NarL/FixJ family response regulator
MRECLALIFSRDQVFESSEVDPNAEGLLAILEHDCPDVILIDANLPHKFAVDLIQQIRQRLQKTKILALVCAASQDKVVECVVAGAHGCVMEESSVEELQTAVERVKQGESFCSAEMIQSLFNEFAKLARDANLRKQVAATDLTSRELEILRLISEHHDNKQIAKKLSVSLYTVKNHVHNILEKLQVQSRFQAVEYARQRRWLGEVIGVWD